MNDYMRYEPEILVLHEGKNCTAWLLLEFPSYFLVDQLKASGNYDVLLPVDVEVLVEKDEEGRPFIVYEGASLQLIL